METKNKINLAFVLCNLSFGGAERFTLDLIKNLDSHIFNIHLVTIKGGGGLEPEFVNTGITVKLFNKQSKLGLKLIWQLRKYFKENNIQIVHTQLFAGDTWGRIAAILAGVPIIISTEQNVNLDENWLKKLVKLLLSYFTRQIIAISEAVKKYQVEVEKISAQKIKVIFNGIDLERFPFNSQYQIKSPATLGIIGRLTEQKNQATAIRALKYVVDKFPNVKLMLVGEGESQNRLVDLVKELRLEKKVEFLKPQVNVLDYFKQFDVLLMPSLWEGLGIVAIEALAAGVPVIAAKVDGLAEVIDDQSGILLEPDYYPIWSEAIINLLNNPKQTESFRPAGRQRAEQLFDIKKITAEYQKVYLKLYEDIIG